MDNAWPTRQLFGVPIQALTMDEVLGVIDDRIARRHPLLIGVVNAAKVVNMRRDAALDKAVRDAELILADGMAVVWASRLLRRRLPERVPGIDLMHRILARGAAKGYRVYCLGATQEVLDKVVKQFEADYEGVVIAGYHHGYFGADGEEAVARDIEASEADILLVAMTSPKKEQFLERWSARIRVPICHGVGGSFDVVAGKVKRAPAMWQRLGLEWLYRVVQEPRRMWKRYLVTNTLFCWLLLGELFGFKRSRHDKGKDVS